MSGKAEKTTVLRLIAAFIAGAICLWIVMALSRAVFRPWGKPDMASLIEALESGEIEYGDPAWLASKYAKSKSQGVVVSGERNATSYFSTGSDEFVVINYNDNAELQFAWHIKGSSLSSYTPVERVFFYDEEQILKHFADRHWPSMQQGN